MSTSLPIIPRARWMPAIIGAGLLLSSVSFPVSAQKTLYAYTDVPAGAYYENAAAALQRLGALDANELRLRPSDLATRAELVKLIVNLKNTTPLYPTRSSFNDVALGTWYSPFFEAAAGAGWVKGDGNCYGQFRPCTARPPNRVNRAEAAVLLARAFDLEYTGTAPRFPDNAQNQWYYVPIQTAADHCVLQGDADTGKVRPSAYMNRAEMVVMFNRAYENQIYGSDCGVLPTAHISSVTALSSTRVRMTFDTDLDRARAEDESRYTVANITNGGTLGVQTATLLDARTVQLYLSTTLQSSLSYRVDAQNLLTSPGITFSDSGVFTFTGVTGNITGITALSSTRVRMTFDTDLDRARAEDESRYTVANITNGGTLGVQTATLLDARTVQLDLSAAFQSTLSYRVNAQNLLTSPGITFSDSVDFAFTGTTGYITEIAVLSSTRLRVTFDTNLDSVRATQTSRYAVSEGAHTHSVSAVQLLSDQHSVELTLADAMQSQRAYTVSVQNMLMAQGGTFSDSGVLVYDAGSVALRATLNGMQEVPSVVTTATGTGTFTLTASGLQYDVTVRDLSSAITNAYFHSGITGVAGPILAAITFVGNRATGIWTSFTNDQRNALVSGGIYVNVHTVNHPDGEIRGQLLTP